MKITEATNPDEQDRDLILRHLRRHNLSRMPRLRSNALHAIYVTDDTDEVIGGLWAERALDWVFVELLVVPESLRGAGLGRELMGRIEAHARDWGMRGVWLDTYGFQARGFYEKLGYTCFATLDGATPDADKHLLRKYLD